MRNRRGQIVKWFGSNTDIEDRKSAEEAQQFLVDAGATLGGSLDYRTTLAALAKMAVPRIADWARVDIVEDGKLRTLAVEHVDERKVELALELSRRYPEDPEAAQGPPLVLRTGESELITEISEERLSELAVDDLHLGLVRELGFPIELPDAGPFGEAPLDLEGRSRVVAAGTEELCRTLISALGAAARFCSRDASRSRFHLPRG